MAGMSWEPRDRSGARASPARGAGDHAWRREDRDGPHRWRLALARMGPLNRRDLTPTGVQEFGCHEATKALASAVAAARALVELANCCSVPSTAMQQLADLRIYRSCTDPCGRNR